MEKNEFYLPDLDFELKIWKNRLCCFDGEAQLYINRIDELQAVVSEPVLYTNLEELETAYFDFKKRIRRLLNRIRIMEEEMAIYAEDYPIDHKHSHFLEFKLIEVKVKFVEEIALQLQSAFSPYFIEEAVNSPSN